MNMKFSILTGALLRIENVPMRNILSPTYCGVAHVQRMHLDQIPVAGSWEVFKEYESGNWIESCKALH